MVFAALGFEEAELDYVSALERSTQMMCVILIPSHLIDTVRASQL